MNVTVKSAYPLSDNDKLRLRNILAGPDAPDAAIRAAFGERYSHTDGDTVYFDRNFRDFSAVIAVDKSGGDIILPTSAK